MSIFTKEEIVLDENKKFVLDFSSNLNLLAGQNGTYKTKMLEFLYKSKGEKKVYGFSPKRNTVAQELKQAIQQIDTQQKTKESLLVQFQNSSNILPAGFTEYPSFSELFGIQAKDIYDSLGTLKTKRGAYTEIAEKFNDVISNVFADIKIVIVENPELGDILIEKKGQRFSVAQLSTGEREVISLIINLEYLKDSYDVFLIDEPEVHLNWSLEKSLFNYLNTFSITNNKQIIIATHSRIVFDKDFKEKTNFLALDGVKLKVSKEPTEIMVNALAGEAVQYIDSYVLDWKSTNQNTFFIEDETHRMVLEILIGDCHIIECGDKAKVVSMIKLVNKMTTGEKKYYGIVDSDNEDHEPISNLIVLSKYAIENYFLDSIILSQVLSDDEETIKQKIKSFLQGSRGKVGVFKKISEMANPKEYLDFFHDAKGLLNEICEFDWKRDKEKRRQLISNYMTLDQNCFNEIKSQIS